MSRPRVAVVGAGATGLGVALDLATRGAEVVVLERGLVGEGTSGRFHGLAHSGGRYAVTDPTAAAECASELAVLRRIAPGALEPTGGWFVRTSDDEAFEAAWLLGCHRAGIAVREVPRAEAERVAPAAAAAARRIWWVPDGVLEGFELLGGLVRQVRRFGGSVLERAEVTGLVEEGRAVRGLRVRRDGGDVVVGADVVVNAAGPLAGELGRRLGAEVPIAPSYGTMLIFADRRLPLVVNHLEPPSDGDIFVPHGETVILGTTDVANPDGEAPAPTRDDVARLVELGARFVPAVRSWRPLRAFTGVRPLVADRSVSGPRGLSRSHAIVDHGARDGIRGLFAVIGGKWTTYRLMGEQTADLVAGYLGIGASSVTRSLVVVPARVKGRASVSGEVLCQCEGVGAEALRSPADLAAWRRDTWATMGPCQGTFCAHRLAARAAQLAGGPIEQTELAVLRAERARGLEAAAYGAQAQLAWLASEQRRWWGYAP